MRSESKHEDYVPHDALVCGNRSRFCFVLLYLLCIAIALSSCMFLPLKSREKGFAVSNQGMS